MSQTTDRHEKRVVGPEHRRLDVFVGRWRVEGRNAPQAPGSPGTSVLGEESYEWLPGGFFLMNRWNRRFSDGGIHQGTGIIGHEPGGETYTNQAFDNLGYARNYALSNNGRTWSFAGKWERATVTFSDDGRHLQTRWEISKDGNIWQPLCDLASTKEP